MEYAIQLTGWMSFFILLLTYLFSTELQTKRICGWVCTALAVGLSLLAAYPPADRELISFLEARAKNKDTEFEQAIAEARRTAAAGASSYVALQKAFIERGTVSPAGTLTQHGTTTAVALNLRKYFPDIRIRDEKQKLHNTASISQAILLELQRKASGKIRLGLDLKGGSSFLLEVPSDEDNPVDSVAMEEIKSVMMRRVDALGLAEPIVQIVGQNRILIQLPGVSEAQREDARAVVQRPAYLEFRLVHENNEVHRAAAAADQTYQVPGYKKFYGEDIAPDGTRVRSLYFLEAVPRLKGKIVKAARPDLDEHGNFIVRFDLYSEAAAVFADLTTEYCARGNIPGRRLAIVLDGEVQSAPTIVTPITGGSGQITGRFTRDEVRRLAMVLTNPLDKPVRFIEERNVDASLGADSIRSGVTAGIIGACAVVIFMAIYYLLTGLIANIAVLFNVIILVGIMALFPFTLTLPGIAGIVLTIGMAVDANVLINERVREESNAGKPLRAAIAAGYGKAFWTIFDSNVTTLMTALILIMLGSGPVKGFGITLSIGLLVNMFTAVVFTRLLLDFLVERGWVRNLRMLHVIGGTHFDFLKYRRYAAAISAAIILLGGFWFVQRRGVEGLLPVGGEDYYEKDGTAVMTFERKPSEEDIRRVLENAGFKEITVRFEREGGAEALRVRAKRPDRDRPVPVIQTLSQNLPEAGFKMARRHTLSEKLVAAIHAVIPRRGADIYGIDFRGGVAVTLNFKQRQNEDDIRKALERGGFTDTFIQHQRELATGRETLQIKTAPVSDQQHSLLRAAGVSEQALKAGTGKVIAGLLNKQLPGGGFEDVAVEEVGSVVSKELKTEAFLAIAIACILILIYIALRFEFGFGLGAVIALLHDVLVTVGLFAISGRQFSLPMVAAILTIIGFSINDTIVIFDRIREDLKLHGATKTMAEIMNNAINQTLSRTIITSLTVMLATISLFIWGGGVINDFAFTFLVGIVTGTYSSIFIASPVLWWWHKRQASKEAQPSSVPQAPRVLPQQA